ncbi:hypothetical protein ACFX2G_012952 [Malus domestica]
MEDPNKHLKEFEVVCSSKTPVNVDGSILKMKAFPFSLLEKAKDWLYELAPGTVTSWESMKRAFLEKFFPTSRVILLRKRINGIQQNQDASAGGALVDKTPMAAKTLIANRALNAQQYEGVGQRDTPWQQVNEMAEGMRMKEPSVCGVCSIQGYASEKCPQLIENGGWESANVIDFKATTSQGTIHILIRTIQVGETIQISSGWSLNSPNNKEALGSNLRASIPSNTHQHKPHNNLPKTPQVHIWIMTHFLSYSPICLRGKKIKPKQCKTKTKGWTKWKSKLGRLQSL